MYGTFRQHWPAAAACVIPAVAAVHALLAPAVHPLLTPDSPGYLYFAAGRPLGYPLLLWGMSLLGSGYAAVRPVQILLFCAAGWALGSAARRHAGLAAALLLQALLFGYPAPMQQADQILSDSLSTSIGALFVAALLWLAAAPSLRRYSLLATVAGLGITIRPDNLALAAASALAILLLHGRTARVQAALCAALITAVCAQATPVAHALDAHAAGRAAPSNQAGPLSRGLIQKVLFLPHTLQAGADRCSSGYIDGVSSGLVAYWRQAPAAFQDVLRLRISNLLRYDVIFPGLAARQGAVDFAGIEAELMCYTALRANAQFAAVAFEAIREYRNLVLNYTFVGQAWQTSYSAYVRTHPPPLPTLLPPPPGDAALWRRALADTQGRGAEMVALEQAQDTGLTAPPARNPAAIVIIDGVQAAGCAASLAALAVWLGAAFRRSRLAQAVLPCAVLGLALQLHLVATASLEIAQPRYVFPVWPLFAGVLFEGAILCTTRKKNFERTVP